MNITSDMLFVFVPIINIFMICLKKVRRLGNKTEQDGVECVVTSDYRNDGLAEHWIVGTVRCRIIKLISASLISTRPFNTTI